MYKVHEELMGEGASCHTQFPPSVIRRINETKMMVKRETNIKGNDVDMDHPADTEGIEVAIKPRQIMCSSPENTVLTMPTVKRLQGLLRARWHEGNWLVYGPGCDVSKIAKRINEWQPPAADNSDFGNYDACRKTKYLEAFIRWCSRHGAPLGTLDIIRASAITAGRSRWGWEFEFHELLGSGRSWTTLFNTWLNNSLRAYIYCKATVCTPQEASQRVMILGAGDDGITVFSKDEMVPWEETMGRLGFDFEVKHVREYYDYEFCSMRLFRTSQGLEWLDCPGRVLAKLGWSVRAQMRSRPGA
jgi:hypothetical protein